MEKTRLRIVSNAECKRIQKRIDILEYRKLYGRELTEKERKELSDLSSAVAQWNNYDKFQMHNNPVPTTPRKTYADLTKEQLIELFRILLSLPGPGQPCDYERIEVRDNGDTENVHYVALSDGAHLMRFGVQGGNVWLAGGGRLYNFYDFVDMARFFGCAY
ncbi:hypothetical protein F5984_20580 [Rudanella paleaurantiibacter]|uniref:Uncharacterized protein n=1 Tax=Rudanella paleaurantiibacter TaxID=2614655 RepID=A0A7J5TVG9_9BACT|nr:hypothetical protein [Rudanella paleaurantiibacter]KAB7728144.1 hypothetical protein F5984_20580 [Rudanella paleaurantiibacter]